jgi:hypothetical protein
METRHHRRLIHQLVNVGISGNDVFRRIFGHKGAQRVFFQHLVVDDLGIARYHHAFVAGGEFLGDQFGFTDHTEGDALVGGDIFQFLAFGGAVKKNAFLHHDIVDRYAIRPVVFVRGAQNAVLAPFQQRHGSRSVEPPVLPPQWFCHGCPLSRALANVNVIGLIVLYIRISNFYLECKSIRRWTRCHTDKTLPLITN